MSDERVLVTGAAGFVGACAVRRLLDRGGIEVHAMVRPGARAWRLAGVRDRLRVHEADLRDASAVHAVLDAAAPALVVHLGVHGAYEPQADEERILSTVVLGTANVLRAAERAGVRLLVNAGSSSEYGFRDTAMSETDRLEPNSAYAVAKAAQTHLCTLFARAQRVPGLTLRLFSVYGPWEEPTRLVPTLLRRARAGLPLEMAAPALARDYVYVEDVLDAMLDFESLPALSGEVLNLGTGVQTTLAEMAALVLEVTGSASEVRWDAMPPRRWDHTAWRADVSRARARLGWSPRHDLGQGLRAFLDWLDTGDPYGAVHAA